MNTISSALHDATHRVPGVPDHHENSRHARSRSHVGGPRAQSHLRHRQASQGHQAPPRILIAWQNWIARVVGRKGR
jgi:hypothetical protein